MKLLLVEDVRPVVAQIAECLADWYKRAQTIYLKVWISNRSNDVVIELTLLFLQFQTQILAKDVITCDDALYSLREQISNKKEELKMDDVTRVYFEHLSLIHRFVLRVFFL